MPDNAGDHLQALDRFTDTHVLCIGDVMLDRFVYGTALRISPEAPIPVLNIERESVTLGGAGNVAGNIAALGGRVFFVTTVGEDEAGNSIRSLLRPLGGGEGVVGDSARPTTVKTRFVSGAQQLLRADHETTLPVAAETEAWMIAHIAAMMTAGRAVVISDYQKGVVTRRLAESAIGAARMRGIPVIVDSKTRSFSFFQGATVLKPNRRELNLATGMPVRSDAEIEAAARSLIAATGVESVVATRSEQGISVIEANGGAAHFHTRAREVYEVSGAGDTVAATLAMALGSGATLVEAVELANHAAGIVVGKIGTAPVRLAELRDAVRDEREGAAHKVKTIDGVADQVERWRARGVRIGFTNGCFDILHPGHIALLAEARRACDRLIVGLNSDASVRRLKGASRPVNDESSRAAVLAALEDVDAVTVFGEDTPLALIERLRPDVLVKGADYTLDKVVGADFVISHGGAVVLADLKDGYSTTGIIRRMGG